MNLPLRVDASYLFALPLAVLVHVGAAWLVLVKWGDDPVSVTEVRPYYIAANLVSQFETPEQAAQRERERAASLRAQQRRSTEDRIRAEQEEWEREKQRLEEAHRRASEQANASEDQGEISAADRDRLRSEFETDLARAVIGEQGMRRAVTDDEKAMAYVAQIQQDIIANWSRPPSARNGMQALLRVRLVPTGEVVDVKLEESSGNDAFDRSALVAVRKAERFLVPDNSRLFERNFREFTVLFRPEDLRL